MRRAAVQALRTARRAPVRRILSPQSNPRNLPKNPPATRSATFQAQARNHGSSQILSSSMYTRGYFVAALVALIAPGVYFKWPVAEPTSEKGALVNTATTIGVPQASTSLSHSGNFIPANAQTVSPTAADDSDQEPTSQPQRKALVVEDDQFYTRDIVDDAPLSKDTGAQGQQQLEMLTPEQATEKLRRTEESYLVHRGRGVVRYDVVQVSSNNPIEDDHAEKVVEVPQTVTPPESGSPSSDWMFWGVFDGHRYIYVNQ